MSVEDILKQFSNAFYQAFQLMIPVMLIAVIVALLGVGKAREVKLSARPKTAKEAVNEVLGHNGWVLVTVDEEKCGYCGAVKIMLDVRGIPYKEVNITDVPSEELDELVSTLGIDHVPVLIYVEDGRILIRKHFTGEREKDIKWVRELKAEVVA